MKQSTKQNKKEEIEILLDASTNHMQNVFGECDAYIQQVEKELNVSIIDRDGKIKVFGAEEGVIKAKKLLVELFELSERGNKIEDRKSVV